MLLPVLAQALSTFISIYLVLLIIRILLSWFPNLDWSNPVLSALSQLTDPYLNLFRSIIPPLGGIDLSPILAFIVLQILQSALTRAALLAYSSGGFSAYASF
ncbi:MAG: YggT family protein [Leptolyngbya sp. SIO4C1]|nr:YggT family protein [Leptolyngbya sp. SIO4C1]